MIRNLIVVRGGGDIATGTIHKLMSSGFPVLVLETPHPSAIRRKVAFSEAVYEGRMTVEGISCTLAQNLTEAEAILARGEAAMLVDEKAECLKHLKPIALVDAILAKKNLGTNPDMAPVTIALGPGFTAPHDVDVVIETMRGHNLGRLIYFGQALPNTGIPGEIAGVGAKRVIHAAAEGIFHNVRQIPDTVEEGETIAYIETADRKQIPVAASVSGILRGLLREGYPVTKGFKVADIDPRLAERNNCYTISDKARCIAGGVLEAVLQNLYLEKVSPK